jgi:hypothetical protein
MGVNLFLGKNAIEGELEEVFSSKTEVSEGAERFLGAAMYLPRAFASDKGSSGLRGLSS